MKKQQRKQAKKMLRVAECVAFANRKGGTGKTTSCLSIAGYLAKSGSKVLVVDFDPQANATSGLGVDTMTLKYSMYDAILDQCDSYEVCRQLKETEGLTTKVILYTGYFDAVNVTKARAVGADDFLGKDSDFSNMRNAIKELV